MTIKISESRLKQMIASAVAKHFKEKDIRNAKPNERPKLRRFGKEGTDDEVKQALLDAEDVRIVNAEDTSEDKPDNNTSWREYWEEKTGKKLEDLLPEKNGKFLCPGYEHHKEDDGYVDPEKICGCHVQKVNAQGEIVDDAMYITPMCSGCNKRINDVFKVGRKALVKR